MFKLTKQTTACQLIWTKLPAQHGDNADLAKLTSFRQSLGRSLINVKIIIIVKKQTEGRPLRHRFLLQIASTD